MTQAGDKGTLIHRLELHEKCTKQKLTVEDGRNPCNINIGDLKKYVARAGLSPIGTADELLTSLVNHLSEHTVPALSDTNSAQSMQDTIQSAGPSDIEIAKKILQLDASDDYVSILNIAGGGNILSSSPIAVMRKAYLKLSLLIHPDKLQRKFDQATKAFQALVRAFERLSAPNVEDDIFMSEEKGGKSNKKGGRKATSTAAISRSNEGCFRTRVRCPRCREVWSEGGLDGNPDYFYNFLMMGLKTYTCSTCLCEFGCVTALHNCPFCKKYYEYSPQDYHRHIRCGNAGCTKEFGFYLYHVSPRMMTEIKMSVMKDQEDQLKARRAKERRAVRSARGTSLSQHEMEKAFVMGLEDCCPRCGESFEGYPDEETQRLHLMNCTDDVRHMQYRDKKGKAEAKSSAAAARQEKQEAAKALAAWEFLGAKSSQLYLLDESHLEDIAIREGALTSSGEAPLEIMNQADGQVASTKRSKSALVTRIANNRRGHSGEVVVRDDNKEDGISHTRKKARSDTSTSGALVVKKKKLKLSADDIPPNMQRMTLDELELFCASFDIKVPPNSCKSEVIDIIEDIIFDNMEDM